MKFDKKTTKIPLRKTKYPNRFHEHNHTIYI